MRLLYLYRYGILGGVATQLANRLRAIGDQAEMHFAFLHDHGGATVFGEHPWVHIPSSLRAVRELVGSRPFDAVVVIDTPEVFAPIRDAGYAGPVINEVHTTTSNISYLTGLRGERIDAFLAPSRYLCDRVEQEFGFAGEVSCHCTPNCLDTGLFRPLSVTVPSQRKVILWVGKLDDHKNWRGFLAAGRRLLDARDDCELWMVGGETAHDPVALELLDHARELGLLGRLRWLQRVTYDAMPRLYAVVAASGGITLSTSRDESFGMTVAESLACGCPAVAAAVGALPEILDGPLAAGLYPFFDVEAAVAAAEPLLGGGAMRQTFVAAARRSIVERYDSSVTGPRYLETVRRVIAAAVPLASDRQDRR